VFYSVFTADTLLYAATLTFDPVALTFDLWPEYIIVMYRLCVLKLYTKFERNRAIRGGVIAIWIFDLMTSNMRHMLRYTLRYLHKV